MVNMLKSSTQYLPTKKKEKKTVLFNYTSILFFHIRVETGKSSPKKIVLVLIVLY